MLTVTEARHAILERFAPLSIEPVDVENALGRVSATRLVAPVPIPRFDNSAMDGFAVKRRDIEGATEEAPAVLELVGEVKAGAGGPALARNGTCLRIMTGAPLPPGADTVVPIEQASENENEVAVRVALPLGSHIRPAGDDVAFGDVVVEPGTALGAGELALAASLGLTPLEVFRRPRVTILSTGDELVAPQQDLGEGQIRDSNSVALKALTIEAGGIPKVLSRIPDMLAAVRAAIAEAAETSDVIVSSGGVSVGRYDFVKEAVAEKGEIDLWRVAMQPGKPVVGGVVDGTPFIGLPGNPVSVHVGFEQFVRPAIRKMLGLTELLRPVIGATITERLTKKPGRLHFVRVRLSFGADGVSATPTGKQGSHIQSSLIGCDGVARFDPEDTALEPGDRVEVELWRVPPR